MAGSSSVVVIGGQTINAGTSGAAQTVVAGGQTFTVSGANIIAPSTTVALAKAVYVPSPTPTPVTIGSLTMSVGASQVVIAGTTYSIGAGSTPTTVVYQGTTLSIGPGGVGIPSQSTTVAPEANPLFSTTAVGGLTFSVDASEAIISGTTYVIGAGAKPTTVVIGGQTVSIGSNGVGLASTTLAPYTVIETTATASKTPTGDAEYASTSASSTGDRSSTSAASTLESPFLLTLLAIVASGFLVCFQLA